MASQATEVQALLVATLALVVSVVLTLAAMHRARRLQLLDTPERRRLHTVPTPRGGGVGPIMAILLVCALWPQALAGLAWPLAIGLLAVAAISWLDDHRSLAIRTRLWVHLVAAAIIVAAFIAAAAWPSRYSIGAGLILVVAVLASINLHNFMDGSDAHLTSQVVFVFAVLAGLAGRRDAADLGALLGACTIACAAFLPFNWPPARIFLGDVGSISFGFLIAAFSLVALQRGIIGWGGALILSSTFMIDAVATLVGRMRRTRHWHAPHRDHLYQWLRRRGWGAARVVVVYQGWNLLLVLPALVVLDRHDHAPELEFWLTVAVYGLGVCVWCAARRALWRHHRAQ
ncbi:MAG TPA: glycosyl transferase family 4 [Pseudomonadota bacterium]|nr:glycosyl transferase family 4 [Rhodanobacteraceae bacterium]MBP9155732.1 glycosyl transferase family 4 [Xanthomonadales bacterium]HQW80557.1 glycosyl transferase family 4 [Pseudomonadota bacterium]